MGSRFNPPDPQPVDALGRDVGVHNDATADLAGSDNDHPELVPERPDR